MHLLEFGPGNVRSPHPLSVMLVFRTRVRRRSVLAFDRSQDLAELVRRDGCVAMLDPAHILEGTAESIGYCRERQADGQPGLGHLCVPRPWGPQWADPQSQGWAFKVHTIALVQAVRLGSS